MRNLDRVLLLLIDKQNTQIWSMHFDQDEASSESKLYRKLRCKEVARLEVTLTEEQDRAIDDCQEEW